MEQEHIKIQFSRLCKHYDSINTDSSDIVSLLDLSHTLRIWTEMKSDVDKLIEDNSIDVKFPNCIFDKDKKKFMKGSITYHLPLSSEEIDINGMTISDFSFYSRALSPEEIKDIYNLGRSKSQNTHLSFSQWMSSEIIKVNECESKQNSIVGISREMLIKRVSNILGASHPMGKENSTEFENRFDEHIKFLDNISIAGIPTQYYQLLEISKIMINKLNWIHQL